MGAVLGTAAVRVIGRGPRFGLCLLLAAGCGPSQPAGDPQPSAMRGLPPPLPDTNGLGVPVLTLEQDEDGGLWAGTYGRGLYLLPADTQAWQRIAPGRAGDTASISSDIVNSIGFTRDGAVWYGSVGGGFGRSVDGGRSWRNWTSDQLGAHGLYVAHRGIATLGDTVFIATLDGLRISDDGGQRWLCVGAEDGGPAASGESDGCAERVAGLPTEYLLAVDVGPRSTVWAGHLMGLSMSEDGGRTWRHLDAEDGIPRERVRAVAADTDSLKSIVWVATESRIYVDSTGRGTFKEANIQLPGWRGLPGGPRAVVPSPGTLLPAIATSFGMAVGDDAGGYRVYYLAAGERYRPAADMWSMTWWGPPVWPIGASAAGLARVLAGSAPEAVPTQAPRAAAPAEPRHAWFTRPIALDANPFIDGTQRYGSMAGATRAYSGIRFNNPPGSPVRAIGAGVVVFAGPAEGGVLTVAVRHDRQWEGQHVFSTYAHNASIDVEVGGRVTAGDVIARVGSSGGATHDHVRLGVYVAPSEDVDVVADPQQGFPPTAVNPELWLTPLEGTGVVAGRVADAQGRLIASARVHGLVRPYPTETPFVFAETYGEGAGADPAYGENFAVLDVPAGEYLLGVEIRDTKVWRRVTVAAGSVTFVEFNP